MCLHSVTGRSAGSGGYDIYFGFETHCFLYVVPPSSSELITCGEMIAVCSESHKNHINTLCGQNVELLNVKLVVHIVTTGL